MSNVSVDDVLALNEQLALLDRAGVPIDLGDSSRSTEQSLALINDRLLLRTRLGQPAIQAIAEDDQLPAVYRYAVLTGIETGRTDAVLDGVSSQALVWDDLRQSLGRALLQPLVLLMFAYGGMIFLCLWFSPSLEGVYAQVQERPNQGVQILIFLRQWMGLWVPLVPLLAAAAIFLFNRGAFARRPALIGSEKYLRTTMGSAYAEQVARLLSAGVPLGESVRLAGRSSGDEQFAAASEVVATHEQGAPFTNDEKRLLRVFPPMLKWALTADLGGESLPELLRFISRWYRRSAEQQSANWQIALPTVVGAILGGVILLLFSLSMFGPYIGLLRDLAR